MGGNQEPEKKAVRKKMIKIVVRTTAKGEKREEQGISPAPAVP